MDEKRHSAIIETDLHYTFAVRKIDLISDISNNIKQEFPDMEVNELEILAKKSLGQIESLGNRAVYDGLVCEAMRYAKSIYYKNTEEKK